MAQDADTDLGDLEARVRELDEPGLRALQDLVVRALEERRQRRLAEARERLEAVAAEYGVSLAEVAGSAKPAPVLPASGVRRSPRKRKFRNPANPEQTWSGAGRRPKWVEDHLAGGGELKDLRDPET